MNPETILIYLKGFGIALGTSPILIWVARREGWLDMPDDRKVHRKPLPRIGGIAVFIGAAFALLPHISYPVDKIFTMGSVILFIGLLDDIYGLPALFKLVTQILVAIALWYAGIHIQFPASLFASTLFSFFVTLCWLLLLINGFNLIDGLDGLSTGIGVIATLSLLFLLWGGGYPPSLFLAGIALLGVLMGFLPYNFYPARIFLGDSGSTFIGFFLASLYIPVLSVHFTLSAWIVLMIFIVPISDVILTVIRRVRVHRSILQPDREHIHHRLMDRGLSHRRTVYFLYGLSVLSSSLALLLRAGFS